MNRNPRERPAYVRTYVRNLIFPAQVWPAVYVFRVYAKLPSGAGIRRVRAPFPELNSRKYGEENRLLSWPPRREKSQSMGKVVRDRSRLKPIAAQRGAHRFFPSLTVFFAGTRGTKIAR